MKGPLDVILAGPHEAGKKGQRRRGVCTAAVQAGRDSAYEIQHDGEEDFLLTAEVVVDRPLAKAYDAGDLSQRRRRVTASAEQRGRRPEDLLPATGPATEVLVAILSEAMGYHRHAVHPLGHGAHSSTVPIARKRARTTTFGAPSGGAGCGAHQGSELRKVRPTVPPNPV